MTIDTVSLLFVGVAKTSTVTSVPTVIIVFPKAAIILGETGLRSSQVGWSKTIIISKVLNRVPISCLPCSELYM